MYKTGVIQIYLMAAISFERYFLIHNPLRLKKLSKNIVLIIIIACFLMGIIWAALPNFGWSYYSLEGALTSCSVQWFERSFNVISFNITMFVFVFFIPLIVILFTNIKLILMVNLVQSY